MQSATPAAPPPLHLLTSYFIDSILGRGPAAGRHGEGRRGWRRDSGALHARPGNSPLLFPQARSARRLRGPAERACPRKSRWQRGEEEDTRPAGRQRAGRRRGRGRGSSGGTAPRSAPSSWRSWSAPSASPTTPTCSPGSGRRREGPGGRRAGTGRRRQRGR